MSVEDAVELGQRAIYHATARDAASGGTASGTLCLVEAEAGMSARRGCRRLHATARGNTRRECWNSRAANRAVLGLWGEAGRRAPRQTAG